MTPVEEAENGGANRKKDRGKKQGLGHGRDIVGEGLRAIKLSKR
jgi:hypothetical protein